MFPVQASLSLKSEESHMVPYFRPLHTSRGLQEYVPPGYRLNAGSTGLAFLVCPSVGANNHQSLRIIRLGAVADAAGFYRLFPFPPFLILSSSLLSAIPQALPVSARVGDRCIAKTDNRWGE